MAPKNTRGNFNHPLLLKMKDFVVHRGGGGGDLAFFYEYIPYFAFFGELSHARGVEE